jgi:tight adherence protein B
MNQNLMFILMGGGVFLIAFLLLNAFSESTAGKIGKRLARVSGQATERKLDTHKSSPSSMRRSTADSAIPLFDQMIKLFLPNPDKLRTRLAKTGRNINLGEYLLINVLAVGIVFLLLVFVAHWSKTASIFLGIAVGLFIPHFVTGFMGKRRIRKFLGSFPEAIDTICRGLRSGLPVTESISACGREMPDPVGIEFRRISDGVRMGRSLEDSMWEVTRRIDTPEFRFLIISMAIQRETGGNLAETLGNLAELIRKRRQLRLKIRAMSSEARASAMIIGSLPFLMFSILFAVNSGYVMTLFNTLKGNVLLGFGLTLIAIGWGVMNKMISFEI